MSSIFSSPLFRYGHSIVTALVLVALAFTLLDGTLRWVVLGVAALEVIVTPQILKRAG